MLYGAAELDTEDHAQLSTARGLHRVLSFAHAVGSPEGVLKAACSRLQDLVIEVQLAGRMLQLLICPTDSCAYQLDTVDQLTAGTVTGDKVLGPGLTSSEVTAVKQQVAAQTAALLHVAHVLHLQLLLDAVHRFILLSTWSNMSIFAGVVHEVFSEAVLEAALGSSTLSKEAYINSVLTQPCSLVNDAMSSRGLVKPTGEFEISPDGRVTVQAQMLREFAGAKPGQHVVLSLDLSNEDGLMLGLRLAEHDAGHDFWFAAHLVLGNSIGSDGQLSVV
jgi:hypothetical protein